MRLKSGDIRAWESVRASGLTPICVIGRDLEKKNSRACVGQKHTF